LATLQYSLVPSGIPAIIRRIVSELIDRQLEGWNLERMRANNILDFNEWSVLLV
jgi:hypothetical protein